MMVGKQITCVERRAVEAVMRVVHLLEEAGDTQGALRELEHFVTALEDKVMVPLDVLMDKKVESADGFQWLVKSRPDLYRIEC